MASLNQLSEFTSNIIAPKGKASKDIMEDIQLNRAISKNVFTGNKILVTSEKGVSDSSDFSPNYLNHLDGTSYPIQTQINDIKSTISSNLPNIVDIHSKDLIISASNIQNQVSSHLSSITFDNIANGTLNKFIVNDTIHGDINVTGRITANNLEVTGTYTKYVTDKYVADNIIVNDGNTTITDDSQLDAGSALTLTQNGLQNILEVYSQKETTTNNLTIKQNGRVGMGIGNPTEILDIRGDMHFSGTMNGITSNEFSALANTKGNLQEQINTLSSGFVGNNTSIDLTNQITSNIVKTVENKVSQQITISSNNAIHYYEDICENKQDNLVFGNGLSLTNDTLELTANMTTAWTDNSNHISFGNVHVYNDQIIIGDNTSVVSDTAVETTPVFTTGLKYPREPLVGNTTTYTDGTVVKVRVSTSYHQPPPAYNLFNGNLGGWASANNTYTSQRAIYTYRTGASNDDIYPGEFLVIDLGEEIILDYFKISPRISNDGTPQGPDEFRIYASNTDSCYDNVNDSSWILLYEGDNPTDGTSTETLTFAVNDNTHGYRFYMMISKTIITLRPLLHFAELELYSKIQTNQTASFGDVTTDMYIWYKYDGNFNDASGNNNHAVSFNSPIFNDTEKKIGTHCVQFAGGAGGTNSQYLTVPSTDFSLWDGFTVSCWVMFEDNTKYGRIIDFGDEQNVDSIILAKYSTTNKLAIHVIDNTVNIFSYTVNDVIVNNTWMHISWVITKTPEWRLYVNGTLQQLNSSNSRYPNSATYNNCYIAKSNFEGDGYLKCKIDDFRMYNRALTASEVADLYNYVPGAVGTTNNNVTTTPVFGDVTTDMLAWYKFDGDLSDSSGNGKHFTGGTGTSFIDNSAIGTKSISFPKLTGQELSSTVDLSNNISFSISLWIYRDITDQIEYIVSTEYIGAKYRNLALGYYRNMFRFSFWGFQVDTAETFANDVDKWVHWTCTYNSTNRSTKTYRNGVLIASGNAPSATNFGANSLIIGNRNGNLSGCKIDDLRVYNRELTIDEISELYNYVPSAVGSEPNYELTTVPTEEIIKYPRENMTSEEFTYVSDGTVVRCQASSKYPGTKYNIHYLFDGTKQGEVSAVNQWASANVGLEKNEWIMIDLGEKIILKQTMIYPLRANIFRQPRKFKIYGTNNINDYLKNDMTGTWNLIYEGTNPDIDPTIDVKIYDISTNVLEFRYYSLVISNTYNNEIIHFEEWELYGHGMVVVKRSVPNNQVATLDSLDNKQTSLRWMGISRMLFNNFQPNVVTVSDQYGKVNVSDISVDTLNTLSDTRSNINTQINTLSNNHQTLRNNLQSANNTWNTNTSNYIKNTVQTAINTISTTKLSTDVVFSTGFIQDGNNISLDSEMTISSEAVNNTSSTYWELHYKYGSNIPPEIIINNSLTNNASSGSSFGDDTTDMIVWYKFDGNVTDSSGNGNDLTIVNPISEQYDSTLKKIGSSSMNFNSSLYTTASNPNNNWSYFTPTTMTLSTWIYNAQIHTSHQGIASARYWNGRGHGWVLYIMPNTGQLGLWTGSGGSGWNEKTFNYNINQFNTEWSHIVITLDTNMTKLYINNVLVSQYVSPLIAYKGLFHLGSSDNGSFRLKTGTKLDDFRLYNRVLTVDEISELYNYVPGAGGTTNNNASSGSSFGDVKTDMLAWYKLDGNITDSSGNGNDLTGGTGTSFVEGKIGTNSISFPKTTTQGLTSSVDLSGNKSFSIAFWSYRNNDGDYDFMISTERQVQSMNKILIIGYRNTNEFTFSFFGGNNLDTVVQNDANVWVYWTVTYNSTDLRREIYKNGVLIANDTASGAADFTGNTLNIGYYYIYPFNGKIDDFRVYNRALTASEVADLYNYVPGAVGTTTTMVYSYGDVQIFPPAALPSTDASDLTARSSSATLSDLPYGNGDYYISYSSRKTTDGWGFTPSGIFNNENLRRYGSAWQQGGFNSSGEYIGEHEISGIKGEWIRLKLPLTIKLSYIEIYRRREDIPEKRAPLEYKIFGTNNDGVSWTEILSVSNVEYINGDGIYPKLSYTPQYGKHTSPVPSTEYGFNEFAILFTKISPNTGTLGFDDLLFYGAEEFVIETQVSVPFYTDTQNLLLWYKFDKNNFTTNSGNLGSAYDVTQNSALVDTSIRIKGDGAANLDGSYMIIQSDLDFTANTIISICFWTKITQLHSEWDTVLYKEMSASNAIKIQRNGSTNYWSIQFGAAHVTTDGFLNDFTLDDTSWRHYCFTFVKTGDNVTFKIFKNAGTEPVFTQEVTNTWPSVPIGKVSIGDPTYPLRHFIDDLRFYDRELIVEELEQLYKYEPPVVDYITYKNTSEVVPDKYLKYYPDKLAIAYNLQIISKVSIIHNDLVEEPTVIPGSGGYRYFAFTSTTGTNSITFDRDTVCDILMVGGGGGGGSTYSTTSSVPGAGGGAGGLIFLQNQTIPSGQYIVTVGNGGNGDIHTDTSYKRGKNGENSSFSYLQTEAVGGGGGGSRWGTSAGNTGGSGGGSTITHPDSGDSGEIGGFGYISDIVKFDGTIIVDNYRQGYNGGETTASTVLDAEPFAGGGGGAGETGKNNIESGTADDGDGGNGISGVDTIDFKSFFGITDTNIGEHHTDGKVYFAGGGGTGYRLKNGNHSSGGLGGGADSFNGDGLDGKNNTGGGGSGSRSSENNGQRKGGNGGSGIVIIRWYSPESEYPVAEVDDLVTKQDVIHFGDGLKYNSTTKELTAGGWNDKKTHVSHGDVSFAKNTLSLYKGERVNTYAAFQPSRKYPDISLTAATTVSPYTSQNHIVQWSSETVESTNYRGHQLFNGDRADVGWITENNKYYKDGDTIPAGSVAGDAIDTSSYIGDDSDNYGEWVKIELDKAIYLSYVQIYERRITGGSHRNPVFYVIYGSNDGNTWTQLIVNKTVEATYSTDADRVHTSEKVVPTQKYKHFAITVTKQGGTGGDCGFAELELYGNEHINVSTSVITESLNTAKLGSIETNNVITKNISSIDSGPINLGKHIEIHNTTDTMSSQHMMMSSNITDVSTDDKSYCMRAKRDIWIDGADIVWTSDERIKKDIQDIDEDGALQKILAIEPKTYKYIDHLERGKNKVYGFISQQVRDVIPEATTQTKKYIPNIYKYCPYFGKTIVLPKDFDISTIVTTYNGKLLSDKLRLISSSGQATDVSFVMNGDADSRYTMTITGKIPGDGRDVFVYGTEIDDMTTIDKSYIYTLNVCATQTLSRKTDIIDANSSNLLSRTTELEQRIADIESKMSNS